MAEASPPSGTKPLITESDMEAAQHLIQLSEESSSENIAGNKRNRSCDGEEVHQRLSDKTATKKILEIFGEDEVSQPKKQKRYRSLVSIYMATTRIIVSKACVKCVNPLFYEEEPNGEFVVYVSS